ncbi:flavodoxin family protein [Pseudoflavonifractor hominis]|uniref:Flavodoxin family protein n=1 Tax=Pseudoflavonifractor hominis TaxID=2763059 RepID=A0ABR7HQS4_9FIRM|nr:flavodoxin family protein [Pseudoflavonifractor hominis]MBC5729877.1 flavodoxin family protein [Pseudoflavonifractor hominis]
MRTVRILGVSASPRKGATLQALQHCLDAAKSIPGVETELIDLSGKKIHCCINCNACRKQKLSYCPVFQDDFQPSYLERYRNCDGIILASPLYMMNPTGLLSNFIARMRPGGGGPEEKAAAGLRIGGTIAVGGRRNGGQDTALAAMNALLQSGGTNVVGGGVLFYNGASVWSKNQKVLDDPTGQIELEVLGRKVAALASIVVRGMEHCPEDWNPFYGAGCLSKEQMLQAYAAIGL